MARALRLQSTDLNDPEVADIDRIASYDCNCQFCVHVEKRFGRKELKNGHKEDYEYLFSCAYMECVAHFHGEMAEFFWPTLNQIGGYIREMNRGHRHDSIIDHHGDWNWNKKANAGRLLAKQLADAQEINEANTQQFISFSKLHSDKTAEWKSCDRLRPVKEKGKEVQSVYRHMKTKGSVLNFVQAAIYDAMLSEEANINSTATVAAPGSLAALLQDGIKIQDDQLVMPTVAGFVSDLRACDVQDEKLYLPSDFFTPQRFELKLQDAAEHKMRLREGEAYDAIHSVQTIVNSLSTLYSLLKKHDRGQAANTQSTTRREDGEFRRDLQMARYNAAHTALISLDEKNVSHFPVMTEHSTVMKSTMDRHPVGASRKRDGAAMAWGSGAMARGSTSGLGARELEGEAKRRRLEAGEDAAGSGTQMPRRQPSDRFQWARTEAEMERQQEQYEQKLAEFKRKIRSFERESDIWSSMAKDHATNPGHAAYAKKKAAMFAEMGQDCKDKLRGCYAKPDALLEVKRIVDFVMELRGSQDARLAEHSIANRVTYPGEWWGYLKYLYIVFKCNFKKRLLRVGEENDNEEKEMMRACIKTCEQNEERMDFLSESAESLKIKVVFLCEPREWDRHENWPDNVRGRAKQEYPRKNETHAFKRCGLQDAEKYKIAGVRGVLMRLEEEEYDRNLYIET
ncbi:hypothetical protein C8J57DRAFT_1250671 [Mycena rebaudengoi]|nr:hypothetical protein C8J57DRAFT_1250671 [Mycena rebaudengoi]